MTQPFASEAVAAAFAAVDAKPRAGLMALRDLIFETAAELPAIGQLEEAMRWGQPSYLTPDTKSGSTLRLGIAKKAEFALFVTCKTSLISDYTEMFPGEDRIEGTRAILFDDVSQIDPHRHSWLVRRALTYHTSPAK